MHLARIRTLGGLAVFSVAPCFAARAPSAQSGEAIQLELAGLKGLTDVAAEPASGGQHRGRWKARCAGAELAIDLIVLDEVLPAPKVLLDLIEQHRAQKDRAAQRAPFAFEETHAVSGPYGYAPYAEVGFGPLIEGTAAQATFLVWAGLLEGGAYAVEVTAKPALAPEARAELEQHLAAAVRYRGASFDPEWSEEEVAERWRTSAPEDVVEKSKLTVVRTAHYLILTNVGKGTAQSFGEKLEECHEAIRAVFPFADVKGQRLLPVFYFVTPDQYHAWYVKNLGGELAAAQRSKGVASGEVYSTYHQATNDPVHIHEATHQIFKNRLGLGGGGSWFQEGVAEYMSSEPNDLVVVGNAIEKGAHVALAEFVVIPSLLHSSPEQKTGGSAASSNYDQAAALIEFVRHGDFCKGKFDAFIQAMGRIARGDKPEIERALQRLFGVDLAGFDAQFVKYWGERKKPKRK